MCPGSSRPAAPLDLSDPVSIEAYVGTALDSSAWFQIRQEDIDVFGRVTHDEVPFHTDPAWARDHSPYGTTIAYGFQTLSLMSAMLNASLPRGSSERFKLNYGFDRVRLLAPVPVGARLRGTGTVAGVRVKDAVSHIVEIDMIVEIEQGPKPAAVARWLFMIVNAPAGPEPASASRPDSR